MPLKNDSSDGVLPEAAAVARGGANIYPRISVTGRGRTTRYALERQHQREKKPTSLKNSSHQTRKRFRILPETSRPTLGKANLNQRTLVIRHGQSLRGLEVNQQTRVGHHNESSQKMVMGPLVFYINPFRSSCTSRTLSKHHLNQLHRILPTSLKPS